MARRPKRAAVLGAGRDLGAQPGPAGADVVQGGDGLGHVERLGVGDQGRRHQADVPGQRGDPGGDQHGVEPSPDLVGAVVRIGEAVAGLQAERVLDGDEVEQPALGLAGPGRPSSPRRTARSGRAARLAPGGGMPARAVQRDGQMQWC